VQEIVRMKKADAKKSAGGVINNVDASSKTDSKMYQSQGPVHMKGKGTVAALGAN